LKGDTEFRFGGDFYEKNKKKFNAQDVFEVRDIEKHHIDQFLSNFV